MKAFGVGLVLVVALGGCLSTTQVSSSTGGSVTSASGGSGTGRAPSTSGGVGASSGSSTGAGTTGSSLCVTAADCGSSGDICLDGGICGSPVFPNLDCVPVGDGCSPDSVCCQGTCGDAGFCTAWSACGLLGQACQTSTDCCWNESCKGEVCAAACGNLATACAHDSDCCGELGLVCRPPSVPTGNPMECVSLRSTNGTSCTPQKSSTSLQCNLGTACAIANDVDPCAPAGFVCDPFYGVCRQPAQYEQCVPGGPACQGISDTSVADLRCITFPDRGYAECLQACRETSDCVGITTACEGINGVQGTACFGNYGCTDYFASCDAEGFGDGTCVPVSTSSGIQGRCQQAADDAGAACDEHSTRQNGGFCGRGDSCIAGLCTPLCNGGSGGPGCASGNCVAGSATGDPVDYGICEQPCDFTDPDGGGCPSSAEVPEKCIAAFMDSFPDLGDGFCALAAPNPPGLGQSCTQQDPLHLDTCGAGQACAALRDSVVICVQLCKGPGTHSTCPAGQSCQYWYTGGVRSTVLGQCG